MVDAEPGGTPITEVVSRYNPPALLGYLMGGIAFVAVGLLTLKDSAVMGGVAVTFGIMIAAVTVVRLGDRRPVLRIDGRGVYDRRVMDRMLPWSEVRAVEELKTRGNTFFILAVDEPMRWVDKPLKRLLVRANGGYLRRPCLYVSAHGIVYSEQGLRDALNAGFAASRGA